VISIFESDYAHAVNIWQRSSIRTLGEYSDLYLKTDVFLLSIYLRIFGIVASSVIDSIPHIIIHYRILRRTRYWNIFASISNFLLTWFYSFECGLSRCSNRYAHTNNKYMYQNTIHRNCTLWITWLWYILTLTTCTIGQCVHRFLVTQWRRQFWCYYHRDRFIGGLRSRSGLGVTATSP